MNFHLPRPPALVCALALVVATLSSSAHAEVQSGVAFTDAVTRNFPLWDKNHDGRIELDELDAAVANPEIQGSSAAAVAALKRASRGTPMTEEALTLARITKLALDLPAVGQANLPRMYREGVERIAGAVSRELFASGSPHLATIHQGRLGNCFCLAPLGAMLQRDPQQVAKMFSPQDDGTWRVTLGKQTVVVAPPTDAELAMTASSEKDGVWVNLYEKAIGEARNQSRTPAERAGTGIDALARGGSAGTMLAFITGHAIERFSFAFAKKPQTPATDFEARLLELRPLLLKAVAERQLMTCGTLKTTTPGLTPNHAYAVLGFDSPSDAVKLWNPYGGNFAPKGSPGPEHGYQRVNGIFEVPLADYVREFSGMAFEMSAPAR